MDIRKLEKFLIIMINSKTFLYIMKSLKMNLNNPNFCKSYDYSWRNHAMKYSTDATKSGDIFDMFTDLIHDRLMKYDHHDVKVKDISMPQKVPTKIDQIIDDMNFKNPHIACKMLVNELNAGLKNNNFVDVDKIIKLCIHKNFPLPINLIIVILNKYSNDGFEDGIRSVQDLCKITDKTEFYRRGEFLHYVALCSWNRGNMTKFLDLLKDSHAKYPELIDTTKRVLRIVIPEVINSRSEAQLVNIVTFVKEFAYQTNDYHPMTILWTHLFSSTWFVDQELSNELLETHEKLQSCIALSSTSFVKCLINENKLLDVYRFLQILLKYNLMEKYSTALQILFDYYCRRNDRNNCCEIVKSSIEVNAPLREEQYNKFISWTVYGSLSKMVTKSEIQKLYSKF